MAIPPEPFNKDHTYGQQPGFVSRHSGKIFITLAILMILGVTWLIVRTVNDGDDSKDEAQHTSGLIGYVLTEDWLSPA